MPIDLPNLDYRRFDDLVAEARRLIPVHAPSWTDHNPSDPGITLIELFASFAEMLMYRVDRVGEAHQRAFVRLLQPGWSPTPGWSIDQELTQAVSGTRVELRAITPGDFERLAVAADPVNAARARCLADRDLDSARPADVAKGHVSVMLPAVPDAAWADVRARVLASLAGAAVLGVRVHVARPQPLPVAVSVTLHPLTDYRGADVRQRAMARLAEFFDPVAGGAPGVGAWSPGVNIYRSDIYALLDGVEGVDYVVPAAGDLVVSGLAAAAQPRIPAGADTASYAGIAVLPHQMATFDSARTMLSILP